MIGPGWMPSRPRPLGWMRRGIASYTSGRRRPARRQRIRQTSGSRPDSPHGGLRIGRDEAAPDCNTGVMLFDRPVELPAATLRPRASVARHRVIAADLLRWLAPRWRWLRPRTVPLLAAFAGMLAILGATKYLSTYATRDDLTIRAADDAGNLPVERAAPPAPTTASPAALPAQDSPSCSTLVPHHPVSCKSHRPQLAAHH